MSQYGTRRWVQLAEVLNTEYHNGATVRKGKLCRERWLNYLNPELNSKNYAEGEWTHDEDITLLTEQRQRGNNSIRKKR